MVIAKIKVDGVTAVATELSQIPKGIQGATIEVTYDGAWGSLNKTAVFSGSVVKDVVNAGAVISVPPETVVKSGHRLRVGFYGVDGENKVIIPTLWVDLGAIQSAADPSGDASTNPALPVWAQLQAEVEALKETGGIKGEKGDPGYTPVKGVDYFDGEKGEPGYTPQKGIDYFDGQNGKDGSNGVSCTHTWNGTTLTVTSASGTSSANLKGEKGDTGDPGADGAKGDKGDKGDTGATGAQGEPGYTPQKGIDYFDGKDGKDGKDGYTPVKGVDYFDGKDGYSPVKGIDYFDGEDGKDGVSVTHKWNGTVLEVTSAAGTSSVDLKGEKGDAYTLNDDDMERIAAAVKASLNTETLMITYEDGSTRAVEVVVK